MMTKKTDWIQTATGKKFYPLEPDAELICIEDIAHALSNQCRYAGHCKTFYSVAQHSFVFAERYFSGWHYRLVALLHDAAEAYLGDLPRPLKYLPEFAFYRKAEEQLQTLIFNKFCSSWSWPETLGLMKEHHGAMMRQEIYSFMRPIHPDFTIPESDEPLAVIDAMPPGTAAGLFLAEFYRLQEYQTRSIQRRVAAQT